MGHADIFTQAVAIVRTHEANRQHDAVTQRCIESFRKQRESRKKRGLLDDGHTFDQQKADAEELALFDGEAARAVNSGAW